MDSHPLVRSQKIFQSPLPPGSNPVLAACKAQGNMAVWHVTSRQHGPREPLTECSVPFRTTAYTHPHSVAALPPPLSGSQKQQVCVHTSAKSAGCIKATSIHTPAEGLSQRQTRLSSGESAARSVHRQDSTCVCQTMCA